MRMKSFVFPLALFFLAFRQDGIAQLLDANCYFQLSPRIFHGTNARLGTTPWIAVISNTTQDLCGGTLIHSRFILTAAHCIKENNQLFVRLGLYDKSCPSWRCTEVEKYSVINSIPHHQYNALSMKNDIGILKLDRQVVYNAQIRPICIFFGIEIDQWSIVHFSAYGWGKTENEGTSSILKTINLSRRSQPCFWSDRETQICAGADKGDTCTGDSGGPLVANITYRGNNFRSQVGIVSFGSTDCNSNGIYTNISSYKQWIKDTISEKDRDQERFLDEDCGNTPQKQGSIRQPWKVNILPSYANGALITKRIVLTVASHLDTDVQKIRVVTLVGVRYSVESVHKHPQFAIYPIITNDIALLKLYQNVPYSDFLAPICLRVGLKKPVEAPRSLTAIIRSWENLKLKHENLTVIDRNTCSATIRMAVEENQICVKQTSFMQNGEVFGAYENVSLGNKFILYGIKSVNKNGVVILTNIKSFAGWISETLNFE